ncbi:MAG: DUF423 domain-containing protein [Pseudomonadota bacterium]
MHSEPVQPLPRWYFIFASINGFMAVGLAALGAHAAAPDGRPIIDSAVLFQLTHAVCLVALFFLYPSAPRHLWPTLRLGATGFAGGLLLFCLPLYWLGFNGPGSLGPLAKIPPVGATGFLIGWAALSWAGLRYATQPGQRRL